MRAEIITFGCRLNHYESEVIKNISTELPEGSVIVHSCSVTAETEKKVKQKIRSIHRANPDKKIVVVGCAVDMDQKEYESMSGVVKVLKNREKLQASNYSSESIITESNAFAHAEISYFENQTRAFVKIQDGCNHSCTFCSVTNTRGESRYPETEEILSRIARFVESGYKEVVFTGVNITDFGKETGTSIADLIKVTLDMFPEIKRLRLSSVDIADLDNKFIEVATSEERFMPNLHLSLQSGSDMILKRMRRRHLRKDIIDICSKILALRDFTFGADLITGFPGEDDEMFIDTANLFKDLPVIHAHVFPYSQRPGTPASKMPGQVEPKIKKRRTGALKNLASSNMNNFCDSIVGTKQNIHVEKNNSGYTENLVYVELSENCSSGEIISAKILSHQNGKVIGVPIYLD